MKYILCEYCGSHLDFGEKCDCDRISEENKKKFEQLITVEDNGQARLGGLSNECTSKTFKSRTSNEDRIWK